MNTLLFSLLLAFNLSGNIAQPVSNDCLCKEKIQKDYLYQHWVKSDKESKNGVIVYRPYAMAEAKKVDRHNKYSGFIIKKGGKFRQLRWRMCGNDNGPSGYNYKWKWKTQNNETLLIVKKRQTYKVLELSKNIMRVKVVKS